MNIILNLAFIRRRRQARAEPAHASVRLLGPVGSAIALTLVTMSACGSNPDDAAASAADSHVVRIVASTNVYGDIARRSPATGRR